MTRESLRESETGEATFTSHPGSGDPLPGPDDTRLYLRLKKTGSQKEFGSKVEVRPDQPALTQLHEAPEAEETHREHAQQVTGLLAAMRFLDLEPNRMRKAAFPGQTRLGDRGENLPTVLQATCADPRRREALAEWTRELTPMYVRDFEFPVDAEGRVRLVLCEENGRRVSAHAASDGTLRFVAMLAGLLGSESNGLYLLEEVDNGIHPSRIRLLLDLIEGRTAEGRVQVVTTTHSPDLLSIANDTTFGNTSVVCRRNSTDDAVIRRVADLPKAGEIRRSQGLGRLLSGWMEDAIGFSEAEGEDAARRLGAIRQKCPEDFDALARRIEAAI